jgi:hypothetical protein
MAPTAYADSAECCATRCEFTARAHGNGFRPTVIIGPRATELECSTMVKRKRAAAPDNEEVPEVVQEAAEAEAEEHTGESEPDAQGGAAESAAESSEAEVDDEDAVDAAPKKKPLKPLSKRRVEAYNEALRKRGIVYLSRVPPFMKPAKVQSLLARHGPIARVSLNNGMPAK